MFVLSSLKAYRGLAVSNTDSQGIPARAPQSLYRTRNNPDSGWNTSSYGRSGKFFAHQYAGIQTGYYYSCQRNRNGFPRWPEYDQSYVYRICSMLGTTRGNHLACSAALAVMDVIEQENLVENAANIAPICWKNLKNSRKSKRSARMRVWSEWNDQPIKEIRSRLIHEQKYLPNANPVRT